ncbi:acyl-CoA dehydrogenase family protein [Kutzneria chonburiensis]|uniref:Acyl-CoA dehydrogenase family protein n=1 Tax=Kutzneria chonburiensis TaxID=1483604 RepID=A0ABV6MM69_9PSEU|nr:acyl-CoA dehydrogenase family protein [Kutzneria chonburiensis]
MSTVLEQCERIARDEGLAAGLAAALSGTEVTAAAPGSFAAVPAASVADGAEIRTHSLADREDIVFLACPGERPAADYTLAEIGRLLAAVRIGTVRRLLDEAIAYLSERTVADEPLIRKQLITGTVGDVAAELELARAYASVPLAPDALADLHSTLDELGWQVTQLFGAAGYVADHAVRALYVSALVANTWIDRKGAA